MVYILHGAILKETLKIVCGTFFTPSDEGSCTFLFFGIIGVDNFTIKQTVAHHNRVLTCMSYEAAEKFTRII